MVQRATALAERLRGKANPQRLDAAAAELARFQQRLAELEQAAETPVDSRKQVYLDARRLLRTIAFLNPLLADIDQLLFIKRHDSVGVFHMCDQFYGCNAQPGGGLFVLRDPFTDQPKLTDLLENSAVESGPAGRAGSWPAGRSSRPSSRSTARRSCSPTREAKAYEKYKGREAYEWTPEYSHHIFKCRADGSGLVQLTDGPWDDFDPCFLPNGRIVFISERRGGYLRCGRHCPVYTLYSMEPDGSDIVCLSYHETHEWHPSVDNDGMLVYSRWDYVDRDTNIAHHLWLSYPDGRDPRSFHGNYPASDNREGRPWMEMSIRAIPGSNKYVASTGAHHGHAFGSLVLIDPGRRTTGPCRRSAADAGRAVPGSGGSRTRKCMAYGTPWPLSEDGLPVRVRRERARTAGIYWIDADGNRELIYRDPAISCLSPIPLRPRPRPPVIPDQTTQTAARGRRTAASGRRRSP